MTQQRDAIVHIALAHKREGIPDMGKGVACAKGDCPGPQGWDVNFGLAGGGYGVYSYCSVCGEVREKDCEPNDERHTAMDDDDIKQRIEHLGSLSPEGMLRELLAVLHADGGHHVDRHGLAASVAHAERKHYAASEYHQRVLDCMGALAAGDPAPDTPEGKLLASMAAITEDYEKVAFPFDEGQGDEPQP